MNLKELINNIGINYFENTYLLIGLYVMVGCLIQKKTWEKTLNAGFKAIIGIFMMNIGADVVTASVSSLSYLLQRGFRWIGIIPYNESITAVSLFRHGTSIHTIMIIGMIINILIAKKTRYKYIFLTGQQMIYMSTLLTIFLVTSGLPNYLCMAVGGIMLGAMMSFFPALIQPYTKRITKKENIAVGHFSSLGFFLCAVLGKMVGINTKPNKEKKRIKINSVFVDTTIATALSMVIMFMISAMFAGRSYVEEITTGTHFLIFALKQGILFATGVYIIISGVRILIQEIIPAFKGIAEKIVPDAIPALDCSILFPYEQEIMVLGFVFSMLGGVLAVYITQIFRPEVIIPSIIIHFFSGAAAGIYGYSTGGKKGAIVSAACFGFLIGVIPLLLIGNLQDLGYYKLAFGEFDLGIIGYILHKIVELIQNVINI